MSPLFDPRHFQFNPFNRDGVILHTSIVTFKYQSLQAVWKLFSNKRLYITMKRLIYELYGCVDHELRKCNFLITPYPDDVTGHNTIEVFDKIGGAIFILFFSI